MNMHMIFASIYRHRSAVLGAALLATMLALGGCSTTPQVFPTLQTQGISLRPGDLEASGIAFITPSAVTGQEEEKQAIALMFAQVLKRDRPRVAVASLAETLGAINKAGLAEAYKNMYDDYRDTGLFKRDFLKQVGTLTGKRYVAHIKLQAFGQGAKERFGILGFRIVETRYANVRLFVQIWDTRDGSVAWEAMQEMLYSQERVSEEPVTLTTAITNIATNIVAKLP